MSRVEGLRGTLLVVLSEHPTRAAVHALLSLCHRMAVTYIKRTRSAAAAQRLGFDGRGHLARDLVGRLFERDALSET